MFSSSMLSGPGYDAFICALKDAGALVYSLGAIGLQSLADVHRGLATCGLRDEIRMLYRGRFETGVGSLHGIAWRRTGADILAAVTSSGILTMVNMSTGVSRSVSLPGGSVSSYKPVSVRGTKVAVGVYSPYTIYVYDAGNGSRIHPHSFSKTR